jgi:RNA polymerase sigma-70 factor, ECF subfamily
MFGLALRIAAQRADAEDALQEAWLRATGALGAFGWRSSLRTWLCGFVVNCVREQQRNRHDTTQAVEVTSEAGIEGSLDVEAALETLAPGHREVLVLHDVMGFTHEEIGELLGVEAGTSKSQLFRARSALRLRLGGDSAAGGSRS